MALARLQASRCRRTTDLVDQMPGSVVRHIHRAPRCRNRTAGFDHSPGDLILSDSWHEHAAAEPSRTNLPCPTAAACAWYATIACLTAAKRLKTTRTPRDAKAFTREHRQPPSHRRTEFEILITDMHQLILAIDPIVLLLSLGIPVVATQHAPATTFTGLSHAEYERRESALSPGRGSFSNIAD